MPTDYSFLSVPENRAAIQKITQNVLSEVEPEQLAALVGFMESLIDMAANDQVVMVDTSDPGISIKLIITLFLAQPS